MVLKLETAQATGSFKARGAMHALLALRDRSPDVTRVVAASAGNHGQALAWAGRGLGIRVRAYVPAYAAATKKARMRDLGAEVIERPSYDAELQAQLVQASERSGPGDLNAILRSAPTWDVN